MYKRLMKTGEMTMSVSGFHLLLLIGKMGSGGALGPPEIKN